MVNLRDIAGERQKKKKKKKKKKEIDGTGFASRFFCGSFLPGRVIPVTSTLVLRWLPCQAPGVMGSALGLVSPVSVYSDWVRQKVGSATSFSVWQHVQLSELIRDTQGCFWDVKQPTSNTTTTTPPPPPPPPPHPPPATLHVLLLIMI